MGDKNTASMQAKIMDFLHKKDLISTIELTEMKVKNSSTILLNLDEDFHEERIDEINEQLGK